MKKILLSIFSTATIFIMNAQTWNEVNKIVAGDRAADDLFANSIGISGAYAIVGAPTEDQNATGSGTLDNSGSAYIFERDGSGNWTQKQKIVSSDRASFDNFGWSVSISGSYAIVGAYLEDEDASGGSTLGGAGSAYIFERDGSGSWTQKQKIVPSDRASNDFFGNAVAISGNYAIVGAYREDEDASGSNNASSAGSAYIFERDGSGNWIQKNKIVASNRVASDYFGYSLSITSEGYAVVGAYRKDSEAGSAYVFERDGSGNWVEVNILNASDRTGTDRFGWSVSISGNYASVGASLEDHDSSGGNSLADSGSSYIFERDGSGNWNEAQKLVPSDRAAGDWFGYSVSVSGNQAVVGAYAEDEDASGNNTVDGAGSAYIFERDGSGVWNELQKIAASDRGTTNDYYGAAVSISSSNIIIGAFQDDEDASGANFLQQAGSAYIYENGTFTSAPYVVTTLVSNITQTTADVDAEVTADGGSAVTERGVCWNTTGAPTTSDTKISSGTGVGIFSASLSALSPNTTYYTRAYATNTLGTSYGNQLSFTTLNVVGLEENNLKMMISPNPVSEVLLIEVDDSFINSEVIIYDIFGRVQIKTTLKASIDLIDTSKLSSGNYLVRLTNDRETIQKKIVKY